MFLLTILESSCFALAMSEDEEAHSRGVFLSSFVLFYGLLRRFYVKIYGKPVKQTIK